MSIDWEKALPARLKSQLDDLFGNSLDFLPASHVSETALLAFVRDMNCPPSNAATFSAAVQNSSNQPVVVDAGNERSLVAIRLDLPTGEDLIVLGSLAGPPSLVRAAAESFQRTQMLESELDRYRKDLDICAAQIGDDFEELTFLRTLTEQLDISDARQDAWQVAQMVLPLLGPMIQAEALILLPAGPSGDSHDKSLRVELPEVWVGSQRISEEACQRFVQTVWRAGQSQPIVENHFGDRLDGKGFPQIATFVLVPLNRDERVLGWLLALNRTHRRIPRPDGGRWELSDSEFGTVEASLLSSVASMLATHLRNTELFKEKEKLLVGVVRAMVSAVDAKDPYTSGHSERVALIGQRLGQELGLQAQACEQLYLTGLLHDVGKIGVSGAVLRKPGKLTDEEFDEIKRHPDQGWAILKDLDQLEYVFPGVLHHHECFDGSGYPDRLAGDAIPFPARILAVADAYDAMTSDRPYRKGMPREKVEDILRGGAGKQWDPTVVDAYLRAADSIDEICRGYQPHPTPARKKAAVESIAQLLAVPQATA